MTAEYRHTPVMLTECMEALQLEDGKIVCDCTLGGAGHSMEIARGISPHGLLIGIDQDDMALSAAQARLAACDLETEPILLKGNFGDLDSLLQQAEVPGIDGVLFDLGISSPQVDFSQRGFSYHGNAPLDMRMDPGTQTITAAEVLNTYSQHDLTRIIQNYGQERWASRIAQFIVRARRKEPLERADQLVELIKQAIPASARRSGGHPARRTFQALRIEVNQEMEVLKKGLDAAVRWLNPGGRIAVLSYHSLEDSIVKDAFKRFSQGCTCPPDIPVCTCGNVPVLKLVTRKPQAPSTEEVESNPRARSARLRVAQKL